MKLYDDLVWRGLIKDFSSPDLIEKLNNEKLTFYIGTDPTADSLHLGHLSSFLISKRLKDAGHNPILLIGGGTGLIGDPRPTTERDMQIKDEIFKNAESLKKQVEKLFGFKVVNNYDWIKEISTIDFLRDYGKYFNVNYMINKDIIRRRLDSGITYCELSYMILQSLDFLNLYKKEGCTLQVAGSDQWGNITSGIDLIRKKTGKEVYGFTMPLVVDKFGNKFGKSEGNALWLDRNKTSPYEIYQYLVNSDDEKVIEYLKIFTFLTHEEINSLEESTKKEPEKRLAQRTLAYEVVKFVHGEEEAEKAIKISESLFTGNIKELADNEIEIAFKGVPTFTTNKDTIINIMVNNNIAASKREAREFLSNNAITLDGETINDENFLIDNNKNYHIIKRGKKKYYLIKMN